MKHRIGFNRLGRKAAHRKAMTRNMVTSLFRYERVRTTKAKALEIRKTAEKMITRAKEDSVHNRRQIGRDIKDKSILAKLFIDIGPRYKERPGGYTRILRLGPRHSDAAEMVLLELVGQPEEEPAKKKKKKSTGKKESGESEKADSSGKGARAKKGKTEPSPTPATGDEETEQAVDTLSEVAVEKSAPAEESTDENK